MENCVNRLPLFNQRYDYFNNMLIRIYDNDYVSNSSLIFSV